MIGICKTRKVGTVDELPVMNVIPSHGCGSEVVVML